MSPARYGSGSWLTGDGVPALTDDAWEWIARLVGGPSCIFARRVMVEVLLEKVISGARYKELAPEFGVAWVTLKAQANLWLIRGLGPRR
ncbi:hypothetical protein LV779_15800 [Streptomyces thinghirensis]|nr:hypothetical protein [Streptomyces thinghirensis]